MTTAEIARFHICRAYNDFSHTIHLICVTEVSNKTIHLAPTWPCLGILAPRLIIIIVVFYVFLLLLVSVVLLVEILV